MLKHAAASAALLLTVAMSTACSSSSTNSSSTDSAGVPSSPPSPWVTNSDEVDNASGIPPPPEVGECRRPPNSLLGANDWVDPTKPIPCSRPHTLETAEVLETGEGLTLKVARQLAPSCEAAAWTYLNMNEHVVKLAFAVSTASPEQREAGQSWVRCDVGVYTETDASGLDLLRGSMHNDVGFHPERYVLCLRSPPTPDASQPFSSCEEPHQAESLTYGFGVGNVTRVEFEQMGRAQCTKMASSRDDAAALVVTPHRVNDSFGFCWVERKRGPLPPL